jgi:membrane peptidoglycan carboxypeptidase
MAMAATLMLVPAAAAAEPVYFHKPNVEREAFEADLSECVELAGGVRTPRHYVPYSPNIYAAAVGAFLAGFMASKEQRHMTKNVLRTCMTDKGYRRVEATDQVSDELKKLDKAQRATRLFTLAAAPEPAGRVLPQ